jgi:hypothetical protein
MRAIVAAQHTTSTAKKEFHPNRRTINVNGRPARAAPVYAAVPRNPLDVPAHVGATHSAPALPEAGDVKSRIMFGAIVR